MHHFGSGLIALFVLGATCCGAFADDLSDCNQEQDASRTIRGCTWIIEHSTSGDRGMAYFRRAGAYLQIKDYDRAIADYTTIIDRVRAANKGECPKKLCAVLFANRGRVYLTKTDFTRAIAEVDQAIRLDPDRAGYFVLRGLAHRSMKHFDQAIADYGRAIDLDPHEAYYDDRGRVYYDKEDYRAAIKDYDRAIQLNPRHPGYYQMRGAMYLMLHEYQSALENFEELQRLDPNNRLVASGIREAERGLEKASAAQISSELGLSCSVITPGTGQTGLKVTNIAQGSAAEKQGIRNGDIIVEINSVRIASIKDMRDALDAARAKGKDKVLIKYQRGDQPGFAAMPIAQNKK